MTDKQNHFTYTDNTSDNNDKIMENLHKQIINITIDDLINGNLNDMEFTAQLSIYKQAVKSLAKELKSYKCQEKYPGQCHCACRCLGNEFCNDADKKINKLKQTLIEVKQLIADALDIDKTDAEQSFDNLYKALEKCEVKDEE